MSSTALGIRLYSLWKMGKLGHNAHQGLLVNGTHFFLDIGSGNSGYNGFSNTKKLEESGWRGVCADPFPDNERLCTALSMPVTATTGQPVKLPDCRGQAQPLAVVSMSTATANCPTVDRAGVGIVDALKLSQAPRVIDYVSLDAQGFELDILKRFPFQDHCVRSWTVNHGNKPDVAAPIQELLTTHGCHLKDAGPMYWARCSCSKSESLLTKHTVDDPAKGGTVMRKDGLVQSKKHRKKHRDSDVAAIAPSGMLTEGEDPLGHDSSIVGIASGVEGSLLAAPLSR